MSLKSVSDLSSARSSSGDVTITVLRVIIAWEWAFTAVSRAIFTSLIDSTTPSASLGMAVAVPASTALAYAASIGSLLPFSRLSPVEVVGPPR